MTTTKKLLTTTEVTEALSISKTQVYRLMRGGVIGVTNVSKPGSQRARYRFHKADVDKLIGKKMSFDSDVVRIEGYNPTK